MDLKGLVGKLGDIGKTFIEGVTKAAIEIALPGFGGALDKGLGRSINPNAELVFESVPFRSFSFPFEFSPKNEKEKKIYKRFYLCLNFT